MSGSMSKLTLLVIFTCIQIAIIGCSKTDQYREGIDAVQKKQFEKAVEHFSNAIVDDPYNRMLYCERGNALYHLKKYNDAINDYRKSIDMTQGNQKGIEVLFFNIGNSFAKMGEADRAIDYYTIAIVFHPRYSDAYLYRSYAYGELQLYCSAYLSAINSLYNSTNSELAKEAKRRYGNLAMNPVGRNSTVKESSLRFYEELGTWAFSSRDWDKAITEYTKVIQLQSQRMMHDKDSKIVLAHYYFIRANAWRNKGSYSVIGNDNSNQESYKANKEAIDDYTRAINIYSQNTTYYHNRGVSRHAIGENSEAIIDYTRALEIEPKAEETYYHRAIAYQALGNKQQAVADVEEALRLSPGHPTLSSLLRELKAQE